MRRTRVLVLSMLLCSAAAAQQAACPPPGSAQLSAPADNATASSPVTLSWTGVSGATEYRIWIIVDGAPATVLDRTTNTTVTDAVPSGTIEWYVEALFGSCPSTFSAHRHFTVNAASTCGSRKPPTLVSPISGPPVSSPVTFTWTSTQGALLYRLWVSVDGSPFIDIDETQKLTLTEDVAPGNVQWYVDVITESCPPIASTQASFVVAPSNSCGTAAPFTITPNDGSTSVTSPVTFSWTQVANASQYRVIASVNGSSFFLLAATSPTETSVTKYLPPGAWTWIVEAVSDQCPSTRSAPAHFSIIQAPSCPSTPPQLLTPANGATNVTSPVTFSWSSVPGAIAYALFARYNDGAVTVLTHTASTQFQKKLADGNYEWYVLALFANCPPLESAHGTFTIPLVCDNQRPTLIVPHDGAVGLTSPVEFAWSKTPKATSYNLYIGSGTNPPVLVTSTTDNKVTATVTPGPVTWYVEAVFSTSCPSLESAPAQFVAIPTPPCGTPSKPLVRAPGQAASGSPYAIRWTPVPNASHYELQEATFGDFRNATTQVVSDVVAYITHTVTQPVRYFYRVRAVSSCSNARGAYSRIVLTVVTPASKSATIDIDATSGATQTITLPPKTPATTFTAKADKSWVTVTPASGSIGSGGATLTVTTDRNALKSGTNKAAITVTYASTSGTSRRAALSTTPTTTVPISVSIATPVATGGNNTPPPNSLIIPAVAHSTGMNGSSYSSDVRLANVSASVMRYQLNFTLSNTDGTQSGASTTVEVDPGATLALDDVLNSFFGVGADGSSTATGMLEVRPLTSTGTTSSAAPSVSLASSRTFNTTPTGTYGAFIAATSYSQFIGNGSPRLSLQHLVQSSAYRTNVGLVEASGNPATVMLHVFDDTGNEVTQVPMALLPGEHKQLNSFLQANNIALPDARIEVEVTSQTGAVSAYASVVDNTTNDAYVVPSVSKAVPAATRFVLPDAEVNTANGKQTDVRLYNAGASAVTTSVAFPGGSTMQVPVPAGQVVQLNNVLQSMNVTSAAGALLITTPSSSSLIVTGRTYSPAASGGTIGQFVPAITPAQSIAASGSAQLLQLENSDQYQTTVGIAETNGQPATVQVSVIAPDAKAYPTVQFNLPANGYQAVPLSGFGYGPTGANGNLYNARVTVKVISGAGRITAYGSVVDLATGDPSYVPAQ